MSLGMLDQKPPDTWEPLIRWGLGCVQRARVCVQRVGVQCVRSESAEEQLHETCPSDS